MIFAGLLRFKLLLVTGITSYGLVGLKAIAFVMLCLFLMILHPIGTEAAVRQRFNLACDARTSGCVPIILYRPKCNILKEGEVEGIATTHGFDCRSVCACQCGLKRHGIVFRCFSSKSFNSIWSTCKMRGGDTLSQHDRLLAVGKWLNNFVAA